MGMTYHALAMRPGESLNRVLEREFGHEYICDGCELIGAHIDDDEGTQVPCPGDEPNAWQLEVVARLHQLWSGWNVESLGVGSRFWGDSFYWNLWVENCGVTFEPNRAVAAASTGGPVEIEAIFDLFTGTGSLYHDGQGEGEIDIDDPMRFVDGDHLVSGDGMTPSAYYAELYDEHVDSEALADRDLAARCLQYQALYYLSIDMEVEAVGSLGELIEEFRDDPDQGLRGRVILAMAHRSRMFESLGDDSQAAAEFRDLVVYREPEDDAALSSLVVSASSGLAGFLGF